MDEHDLLQCRNKADPRSPVNLTVLFWRFPPTETCNKSVPRSTHSLQVDRALVGRRLREFSFSSSAEAVVGSLLAIAILVVILA